MTHYPAATMGLSPMAVPVPIASQTLGISRSRVFEELRHGRLERIKLGHRTTLIPVESLQHWLAKHRGSAAA